MEISGVLIGVALGSARVVGIIPLRGVTIITLPLEEFTDICAKWFHRGRIWPAVIHHRSNVSFDTCAAWRTYGSAAIFEFLIYVYIWK
jgi:hypothetical protein